MKITAAQIEYVKNKWTSMTRTRKISITYDPTENSFTATGKADAISILKAEHKYFSGVTSGSLDNGLSYFKLYLLEEKNKHISQSNIQMDPLYKDYKYPLYFITRNNKVVEVIYFKYVTYSDVFKQHQYDITINNEQIRVCESALFKDKKDADKKILRRI